MKNLKIDTILKLGFSLILILVAILGIVSINQNYQLGGQTNKIFNHPLQVRQAISLIEINILSLRLETRNMAMTDDQDKKLESMKSIEISKEIILKQFDVLRDRFLGSKAEIEEAYDAYSKWLVYRNLITNEAFLVNKSNVKDNFFVDKKQLLLRDDLILKIKKIDDFAKQKAENLYNDSNKMIDLMNMQMLIILASILLLTFLVNYYIIRIIRKPILILTNAANDFHNGDISSRSNFESNNEFGTLSKSFNKLADSIQYNLELSNKSTDFAKILLTANDSTVFFKTVLGQLNKNTNSQIAAIYLLSNDKKTFNHFESIGLTIDAKKSFDIENLEGEFGAVISLQSIQHITNIKQDTRFVYTTTLGHFIPNEMITIPIVSNNELIAVITLASLSSYSKQSIELIDTILVALSARIVGILSYHKLIEFS